MRSQLDAAASPPVSALRSRPPRALARFRAFPGRLHICRGGGIGVRYSSSLLPSGSNRGGARVFDSAQRPGGKGIVPNVEMSTASGTENQLCFPAKEDGLGLEECNSSASILSRLDEHELL